MNLHSWSSPFCVLFQVQCLVSVLTLVSEYCSVTLVTQISCTTHMSPWLFLPFSRKQMATEGAIQRKNGLAYRRIIPNCFAHLNKLQAMINVQ